MKRDTGKFVRRLKYILFFVTVSSLLCLVVLVDTLSFSKLFSPCTKWTTPLLSNYSVPQKTESESENVNLGYFKPKNMRKIDWHNYGLISYERRRTGLGEMGEAASNPPSEYQRELGLLLRHSFNVLLSDRIALNRSLPDTRHPRCTKRLYLESLPSVSVVIPFYNETLSTLLRTLHSVLNRSPPQLLREIIMVDDATPDELLLKELCDYVTKHLPKVKILQMSENRGLMQARDFGARQAIGDVLVILDSHVEANVNWLPPLLEPIALNHRTVVLPVVDIIEPTNFAYRHREPGRAIFTWEFNYWRLPLLPKDFMKLPEPYESPMMEGGLFAISRAFFLELGGYDPGLVGWGGEQFELSFKIWQCGGRMLEAPCSRVGHLSKTRGHDPFYASRNLRRVAEVWMDEYAKFVYMRFPDLLTIDPGDLTQQRALRQQLHCKPFRWLMKRVVFDMTQKFPTIEPKPYAEGRIRPKLSPELCLDSGSKRGKLKLRKCSFDKFAAQSFVFTWHKDVRLGARNLMCWDVPDMRALNHAVTISYCHEEGNNQLWRYDPVSMRIAVGPSEAHCLDWHAPRRSLFIDVCKETASQKWLIDTVNRERIASWDIVPEPITGPVEE